MQDPASAKAHDGSHTNGLQRLYTGTYDGVEPPELELLCAQLSSRIAKFLESNAETEVLAEVQKQTRTSLEVIETALDRYALSHLSLSYNGGKDCLVLLILYLVGIYNHFHRLPAATSKQAPSSQASREFPRSLKSVYIVSSDPFPEADAFVHSSARYYGLNLEESTEPMKKAFERYLNNNPEIQGIFVGTRRADPHGAHLSHLQETDHGWPDFMRIHPVIDWKYRDIWSFIRHFDIPYCPLYDWGYTSLGSTKDTHPNPALRTTREHVDRDGTKCPMFRPAYELQEDSEERLGRKK